MGAPKNPESDPEATSSTDFLFGEDASGAAERQGLPYADLLARLSALMQSCEGCEKVAVIGLTALDAPDSAGCNWSSSLVLEPAGAAPEVYALAYASVIATARASWNLK